MAVLAVQAEVNRGRPTVVRTLDRGYRAALFSFRPDYTAEEIVGSFLGFNEIFPSQARPLKKCRTPTIKFSADFSESS